MSKILKGIDGERFPPIGGITEYRLAFTETIDISTIKDEEILWQVYWSNQYSEYEKVPFSGQKRGRVVTYKFLQNLLNKNLQLKATYKDETVELHITPQVNGEMKIVDVFFLDTEYKGQDKDNLKYLNSLNLQIYTLNMLGKSLDFKIYDTINGEEKEVYKSPASLQIIQKNGIVKTKQTITLTPFMPMQTQKDMSASEHSYKIKVWQTGNETNFYEEELKMKNEMGKMDVPQDSQVPITTGTSEPVKKKEEERKDGKCPRCKKLTIEELNEVFPSGTQSEKTEIMNTFNNANTKFGLDSCQQKAHFFAQVLQEIGPSINVQDGEDLHYRVETLSEHFAKFSISGRKGGLPNDLAYKYGIINKKNIEYLKKISGKKNLTFQGANVQMIANIAYSNRKDLGNGSMESNDGWNYRGRGIIQITGKEKYETINNAIKSDYPIFGIRINANNINNLKEGTVASMAYWKEYGCKKRADEGIERKNLDRIVDIVNSQTPTRNSRWGNLQKMITIFKVYECELRKSKSANK